MYDTPSIPCGQSHDVDFRELVQHATLGIYRSLPSGRFVAVNAALVAMLGYDCEEEMLGLDMVRDVYVDAEERCRLIATRTSAEQPSGTEVRWKRKDGSPITVRLSVSPVRGPCGSPVAFDAVVEDMTERLALEERLRQAQKMEAVGQLTGGIAHDLNNMLTVVLANAELVGAALPPDRLDLRNDLCHLHAAASRAADTIGKLLAFSRRRTLSPASVDVGEMVAAAAEMIRRTVPETIVIEADVVEGLRCLADPAALEQVLLSLVSNAQEAMPHGGVLTLAVDRVCEIPGQSCGRAGEYACLAVRDGGGGMDEPTRARVFEPFFTTKKGPDASAGLSLAMVYGLVKQHGGWVDVESTLGEGTTFRVYLPLTTVHRPAATAPSATLRGGHETILLVEDEEAILLSARRVLQHYGYQVFTASDGVEAAEQVALRGGAIDLVVSDVVMPRMSGPQLYDSVRALGHGMPFLFVSGYAAGEHVDTAHLDPNVPFLSKPWTVAEFVGKVREALDGVREVAVG